jgi:hypothetical protein
VQDIAPNAKRPAGDQSGESPATWFSALPPSRTPYCRRAEKLRIFTSASKSFADSRSREMLGQRMCSLWSSNFGGGHSFSHTEQVHNRDTFAEISSTGGAVYGEDFWSTRCTISQIVSDSGVEDLDHTFAFRKNVTSVTFLNEGYKSIASSRWSLSFWS